MLFELCTIRGQWLQSYWMWLPLLSACSACDQWKDQYFRLALRVQLVQAALLVLTQRQDKHQGKGFSLYHESYSVTANTCDHLHKPRDIALGHRKACGFLRITTE